MSTSSTQKDVSVVVPMKNEQDGLEALFGRLIPILRSLEKSYEIVCVNDGSSDNTVASLVKFQRQNPGIVIVDLSRNFGKEAALTAGIANSSGLVVIPIDADLQDPPELIPEMIAKWESGADVVLAVRSQRESDTAFKRLTANLFYKTINALSEVEIPAHAGDFRLMSRQVVNALLSLPERNRFNKGLFAWLGFDTAVIHYERPHREIGESKWQYRKLWSFALDGVTAFSSLPIRVWMYVGLAFALAAIGYGAIMIYRALFLHNVGVPGYASLMVAVLFSSGMILTGLGVLGEYISRIYIETKQRPLFIVRKVIRDDGTNIAQN